MTFEEVNNRILKIRELAKDQSYVPDYTELRNIGNSFCKSIKKHERDCISCSRRTYCTMCDSIQLDWNCRFYEEEKENVKFVLDGLRFYLYHVKDFDDAPNSYVIGYTIL